MIKTITSTTNPLIQYAVKLHHKKYRDRAQEFIAEGERVIATLIEAHHTPRTIFCTQPLLRQAQTLVSDDRIFLVSTALLQKISTLESPSGIVGIFSIPAQLPYEQFTAGIVLINIQNPGNAGTLLRTAVAMGKKTAIFINSVDAWNSKVVQASAGIIGLINIFHCSWQQLIEHKKNLALCALVVEHGENLEDADLHNSLIVIGNEGHGLAQEHIQQCDQKITISMPGNSESLNASVAGSIALYVSSRKT